LEDEMTVTESADHPVFVSRQRDRRRGLESLLSALSESLGNHDDPSLLRGAFEDAMRRMLPVRSVQLREDGGRWPHPTRTVPAVQSITLDIPGPAPLSALEATFEPGSPLGEWDFQIMSAMADVGALVLEIERGRLRLARAGLGPAHKRVRDGAAPLVGSTRAMKDLRSQIERVSETDFTVLLEGESGVGKELVARQIHELSHRREGPFVALNCAALVETLLEAELFGIEEKTATGVKGRRGKFEHADGGTLFLDEVSDLSLSAQAKLLRAIQDLAVERVGGQGAHRVDIRIVAATNQGLSALVENKLFRPDLFYRLSGVDLRVPTLRERRDDILELAGYFLERHRATRPLRLSPTAIDALLEYEWPGNVRELERLIERAVALSESSVIELDDLPPRVRGEFTAVLAPALQRNDTMRAWGSRYARLVLERCQGNKRAASRVLGISYHTLNAFLRYPGKSAHSSSAQEWAKDNASEEVRTHSV
jgi:transcriptional regulator with PAS, ATPase and Fis domain